MVNSPTMCQRFVDLILQPLQQQFLDAYTYHYLEDILLAHSSPQKLTEILSSLQTYLNSQGLIIAPEKIQSMPPWKYLGFQMLQKTSTPLQFSFTVPEALTVYSLQQFLGHLNWVQPSSGIPTYAMFPLFQLLQGNEDPTSPCCFSPQHYALLQFSTAYAKYFLDRCVPSHPFSQILLSTKHTPTAILAQILPKEINIIEWIH